MSSTRALVPDLPSTEPLPNCVERPGHDPPTAATTQHHHHRDRGTPSATTVDQGWPQHHAEARDAEFAGRSRHDPPTATTRDNNDDCSPGHQSHPHSHCRLGLRALTLRTGGRCRLPNARAPRPTYPHNHDRHWGGTNSTPHYHRRREKAPASRRSARCRVCGRSGHDPPAATTTTTVIGGLIFNRAQWPWRCAQACDADRQMPAHCDPPTSTAIQGSQQHPGVAYRHPTPVVGSISEEVCTDIHVPLFLLSVVPTMLSHPSSFRHV